MVYHDDMVCCRHDEIVYREKSDRRAGEEVPAAAGVVARATSQGNGIAWD